MEGTFFPSFINSLSIFLQSIENNYKKRFKDLELKDHDDKILFEYFLLFIGNSDFSENIFNLINMWNEFLIPLNDEEIKMKLNYFEQNSMGTLKTDFDIKERIITINYCSEKIIIKNIDNYAIVPLINDIISRPLYINLEWCLNKYLKPTKFKDNLFIYKTKETWKTMIFDIFNSKAFKQIKFYNLKQIDFLSNKKIVYDIIDNIQFFTFNCIFHGNTVSELFKIYENGLFNNMYEKSVSLLIYYAFFIITSLHELGGHFYVSFQYFYSLNKGFESPNIEENEKSKYTPFGNLRGKEIGEKLEIKLFGRVIQKLTINEAIFILNIQNYNKKLDEFKKAFTDCNNKNINELIDDSLEQCLLLLGIKTKELLNKNYIGVFYSNREYNQNKALDQNIFFGECSKHSLGLFQDPEEKDISSMLEVIKQKYINSN